MAEYIEREAAIQALCFFCNDKEDFCTCADKEMVMDIPAADVVDVRRGYWAKKNVGFLRALYCCSICGRWEHEYMYEHDGMNYCPNCGAKMDGKGECDV